MAKRGVQVRVSSAYDPQAVNLVIDEFTNYVENHRLQLLRRPIPQQGRLHFDRVCSPQLGVTSFNHFGALSMPQRLLCLMSISVGSR